MNDTSIHTTHMNVSEAGSRSSTAVNATNADAAGESAPEPMEAKSSKGENPNDHEPHLRRTLTWKSLTSMGIGATIGAGIFVMTGIVAHDLTGPALPLSFIVASIPCLFCGLSYAEFAALTPSAGSAYAYTRATMGQFLAFCIGIAFARLIIPTTSAAAVAQSWSQYLNELLTMFHLSVPTVISKPPFDFNQLTGAVVRTGAYLDFPALLITLLLTVMLVVGVKESARFNNGMVVIKISIVLLVIIVGSTLIDSHNYSPFLPFGLFGISFFGHSVTGGVTTAQGNSTGVLAGSAIVFFAFIGFDSVSCNAEEAKRPSRDIPIAILLSLFISSLLYVAVSIVLTGMVPYKFINIAAPLSAAFGQRGCDWARYLVAFGAIVGMTSVLLVGMLAQPRIFLAMSRDGLLPEAFQQIHPRFKTPWFGTVVTGLVVGLVGSTIPLTILVEFVSIGTLVAFSFVCIAVIVMRFQKPTLHRPFRCPFVPLIPGLGVVFCLLLMLSLPATTWYRLLAWFGVGMLVYLAYSRKHGKDQSRNPPAEGGKSKHIEVHLQSAEAETKDPSGVPQA